MKNSFFTRLAAVGALCSAFSAFASNVQAQTLHLVTVESAKSDERNARYVAGYVDQFFRENVPAERLNLVRLEKEKATPDAVVAEIRKLLVGSDDVVVFYFYGLAGDDRDAAGQTFRFFEKGNENERRLSRQKVRAELANLRPRLIVLLSDCDNVGAPMPWPPGALPPAREVSPVTQKLFFEPSGCVDITSSKPGQYSFGAFATRAWISVFREVDRTLRDDPYEDVDWKTVSEAMIEKTEEMFKRRFPDGTRANGDVVASLSVGRPPRFPANGELQTTQTPRVYELPGAPRLGAIIQTRRPNFVVTKVVADSPADRAGMQKGDILVAIRYLDSGIEIRPNDEAEYADAIDDAPRDVEITVKRQNGEQTTQLILSVELNGLPREPTATR